MSSVVPSTDPAQDHHNHLYTVAAITDANGAVIERYGYDAYGKPVVMPDANVGGFLPGISLRSSW